MNDSVSTDGFGRNALRLGRTALQQAVPGLLVSVIFVCLKTAGVPAARSAVYDLWAHAWKVHPFLLAAAGLITTSAVVLQGADLAPDLDDWLFSPVLHFLSHVLCFSAVAMPVLWASLTEPWLAAGCPDRVGMVMLALGYSALALIATGGGLIVHDRIEERNSDGQVKADRSSRAMLWFYLALSFAFFAGCVITAVPTEKTEELLRNYLVKTTQAMCAQEKPTGTYANFQSDANWHSSGKKLPIERLANVNRSRRHEPRRGGTSSL